MPLDNFQSNPNMNFKFISHSFSLPSDKLGPSLPSSLSQDSHLCGVPWTTLPQKSGRQFIHFFLCFSNFQFTAEAHIKISPTSQLTYFILQITLGAVQRIQNPTHTFELAVFTFHRAGTINLNKTVQNPKCQSALQSLLGHTWKRLRSLSRESKGKS